MKEAVLSLLVVILTLRSIYDGFRIAKLEGQFVEMLDIFKKTTEMLIVVKEKVKISHNEQEALYEKALRRIFTVQMNEKDEK